MATQQLMGRIRLFTGSVLFVYLASHFANHALGLISLAAMESGRDLFLALWRNPIGTFLLYGSLASHSALAIWSIYRRRSLNMPLWEAAQLVLGLLVPPLLAIHIIGSRLAFQMFETNDNYAFMLLVLWVAQPLRGLQQVATLGVAWVHGCIGLHFWLRLKPWYPRAVPFLYGAVLLIPVLGLLGFAVGGQEVARLAADEAWMAAAAMAINFPDDDQIGFLYGLERLFLLAYAVVIVGVLAARGIRTLGQRHRAVTVTYPDGSRVVIQPGTSILEASRGAGIPHASVCGGRGRCSTCRVRVSQGLDRLPAASDAELKVLQRVGAAPNVRLACQTRPTADVTVVPLLPPTASPRDAQSRPRYLQGHEEEIAVLFADLRAFTRISEQKLPYDVVFLLNRYFRAMGMAVETSGGRLDKFIGDGVMALFGVGGRPEEGCRQALFAARAMAEGLQEINEALRHDLSEPLRIGIGIHAGLAIVGEMGHGRATSVTAIGDTVNTASRLETLTKDYQVQLVFSEIVAERAAMDMTPFARHEITVRGRSEPMAIRVAVDARQLWPDVPAAKPPRDKTAATI